MDRLKIRRGDEELIKYTSGKRVLVNDSGEWKLAVLDAPATKIGDKKYELSFNGGSHLVVSELPKILVFKDNDPFLDTAKGIDLTIVKARATKDGNLEYDVRDVSTGNVFKGVPEDFLDSWSKIVKMEEDVEVLESQVTSLEDKAQKELRNKIKELKTNIVDVFANLPKLSKSPDDLKKMTQQSRKNIDIAMGKIEALYKTAKENLDDLNKKIAVVKAGATTKKKVVHAETDQDKESRKKEGLTSTESKKQKAGLIVKDLPSFEQQKVEEEKLRLKTLKDAEHVQKVQDWENEKKKPKPVLQKERTFVLDPADKDEIDQEYLDKEIEPEWKDKESRANQVKTLDEAIEDQFYQDLVVAEKQELDSKKIYETAQHNLRHNQWQGAPAARRGPEPTFNVDAVFLSDAEKTRIAERVKRTAALDLLRINVDISRKIEVLRKEKAKNERDRRRVLADKSDFLPAHIDDENLKILEHITKEWQKEFKDLKDSLKTEHDRDLKERKTERYQELRDKHNADLAAWNNAQSAPKPAEPGEVVLSAKEEKSVKDKSRAERIKELIATNSDLESEIEERRKAKAKKGDPRPGYLNSAKDDYEASKIDEINAELFDGVLADWQKDYEFKEKTPEADEFDFNVSANEIIKELDDILEDSDVLKSPGVPKDAFDVLYQEVVKYKKDLSLGVANLQSLEIAKAKFSRPPQSQVELEKWREDFVRAGRLMAGEFLNKINDIKIKKSTGEKYEQKEKIAPIDMSSALVEKILQLDIDKAKVAMKALYRGDAIEEFKNLIPDQQPSIISESELYKAGIKDWGQFKELWDASLAKEVAKSLEKMAEQRMLRKASELMDSLSGLWAKMGSIKGQLALRAGLQTILSGGIGGLRLLTKAYGEVASGAAVLLGGAAGGAGKWGIGKLIFGKTNWAKEGVEATKKVQAQKQDDLVDSLVEETFSGNFSGNSQSWLGKMWSKVSGAKIKHNQVLDGLPMMSSIIAHTVREVSAEKIEVDTLEGKKTLSGSNRLRYERVLAKFETQDLESEQAKQLALVFFQLNRNGDYLQQQAAETGKAKTSLGDKFLQEYAGRGSLSKSVAINTSLSAIFLASGTARMVFGGLVGAYTGLKAGERSYAKLEQKAAKEKLVKRLSNFDIGTKSFYNNPAYFDNLSDKEKKTYKNDLIYFKKFLHGNVVKEDFMAAVQFSEKGPVIDEILLAQIDALVHDAEGLDILMEKKEDSMYLEKVLPILQKYQGDISEKEQAKIWSRFGKFVRKNIINGIGGAVLGATTSALAYRFGGGLIGKAVNKIKGNSGHGHAAVGAGLTHEVNGKSYPVLPEHEPVSGATNPESAPNPIPEVHKPTELELTQNFAAEHGLSVEASNYLKNLSNEFGLKEGSMQHVLDASRVGANIHSHNPEATSSSINTLIEAEGERRTVIFEELVKDHNYEGAAKFLESQGLGKRHLGYLSEYIKKPDHKSLVEFAKNYKVDNKEMVNSLFRAMQAKGNTDLANAGLVVSANEDRTGTTIVIKGKELNYFGLDDNGKPIIAGDGKVLIKETHLANVKTWVSDSNPKLQHEVGYMPPSDDSLFEHRVKTPILDKYGDYVSANNPNVPHLIDENTFSSGRGVETSSQQVLVGNTIATYEASNNELVQPTTLTAASEKVVTKSTVPVEPLKFGGQSKKLELDGASKLAEKLGFNNKEKLGVPSAEQDMVQVLAEKQYLRLRLDAVISDKIVEDIALKLDDISSGEVNSLLREELNREPLMTDYKKYLTLAREANNNGQPIDSVPVPFNIKEIKNLIEAYDKHDARWFEKFHSKELQVAFNPNKNHEVLANGGRIAQVWDGKTKTSRFLVKEGHTFNIEEQTQDLVMKNERGRVVKTWKNPNDAVLAMNSETR